MFRRNCANSSLFIDNNTVGSSSKIQVDKMTHNTRFHSKWNDPANVSQHPRHKRSKKHWKNKKEKASHWAPTTNNAGGGSSVRTEMGGWWTCLFQTAVPLPEKYFCQMTIVQMVQRAGSQLTNNLSNEDGFWPTCHAPTSLHDVLFSKQYNQDLFANY